MVKVSYLCIIIMHNLQEYKISKETDSFVSIHYLYVYVALSLLLSH